MSAVEIPKCAFLHGLGHEPLHFFHFVRGWLAIHSAKHSFAHLACANVGSDV